MNASAITHRAAETCAWLTASLAANRFLPAPPPELMLCGDGDYRAIGAEFLGHFIRHGDLRPQDRVLDIGCGVGRMAVPLTQYLDEAASYDGIDVAAPGIAWCQAAIASVYPRFRFHHLDMAHPLYNPDGALPASATPLPFADAQFDFIAMISVLTHLDVADAAHNAREVARLLAPGGRCVATAFLMNDPARDALRRTRHAGTAVLGFDPDAQGPLCYADPSAPMAAVAFDEDTLLELFLRTGLRRLRPAIYGHWSGRESVMFQDLCVFERA